MPCRRHPKRACTPLRLPAHTAEAQGLGSTIKASLVQDTEQFSLAGAQSLYKSDLTAGHVRVGKRGVCLPPEAMQAVSTEGWQGRGVRGRAQEPTAHRISYAAAPIPTPWAQYEESRKQAEHNKQIGRSTNMKLGLF